MTDTPAEVDARMNALFMQRSGSDRVRMACDMFDLARALMIANITAEHPGITEADLRTKVFERTYGDDFQAADRARIVMQLHGGRL